MSNMERVVGTVVFTLLGVVIAVPLTMCVLGVRDKLKGKNTPPLVFWFFIILSVSGPLTLMFMCFWIAWGLWTGNLKRGDTIGW